MTAGTMSYTSSARRSVRGVPGLAVRIGRTIELWGLRAGRPACLRRADLAHTARAHARRDADFDRMLRQR